MPRRKYPIVTGEYYHVYNRSVAQQIIFFTKIDFDRFLQLIDYYRFQENKLKYSHFKRLERKTKSLYLESLYTSPTSVEILAFSIMPNHYHLLLRQNADNGISNYIRLVQNSYAKYINEKTNRVGSLFQAPFKAIRVETEEQIVHLTRYIHLNPLSSFLLRNFTELMDYKYTSLVDYVHNNERNFLSIDLVKSLFKNTEDLISFTSEQVKYQQDLEKIKHLIKMD